MDRTVRESVQGVGFFGGGDPEEVAPRTLFVPSLGNVSVMETDEGLVLADTALAQLAPGVRDHVRAWSAAPAHTIVYTHGHVDHAFGVGPWLEEGRRPRIVAHRNVVRRFREYSRMTGLNEHINRIQFGFDEVRWPREFFWPDTTYDSSLALSVGGETFELRHAKGETDDATWVWAPERKVLCTGDLWISCAPNCGNPQKVQRYPEEWADALEAMAALGAEALLPGHGRPIVGAGTIRSALTDGAAYLRSIVSQTLDALNAGLRHEEIVAAVEPPQDLADKPYLRPVYDRPEFIVRNLIRRHGGWWDGFAANLMPAPADARAREIVDLAGGPERVIERARALAAGDLPLACHLAEWAALASPEDRAAQECARDLFRTRAEQEDSLMGRGIFMDAVRRAERNIGG